MRTYLLTLSSLAALMASTLATAGTHVEMQTSAGKILIELNEEKAPTTSQNFLQYIESGFYDDTVFHRVIEGFVIQGGGFSADLQRKETQAPIENEADNGLKNAKYTLSMARTSDPSSATSQFFINLQDNHSLDHRDKTQSGWGYAVFAKITEGQNIVDAIAKSETSTQNGMPDVPTKPISVQKVTVIEKPEQ